jgi:hypothetical protein
MIRLLNLRNDRQTRAVVLGAERLKWLFLGGFTLTEMCAGSPQEETVQKAGNGFSEYHQIPLLFSLELILVCP